MVYAIGDVNERSLLTDIAKHQAHVACEVIDGGQARATRDGGGAPRVVFTDPVAAVGLTLQAAKDQRLKRGPTTYPALQPLAHVSTGATRRAPRGWWSTRTAA
jgi:dihydrolipoamide dehydrogenase